MPATSFLEVVLTSFGWHLYNIIWQTAVETGIAYIPIVSIIFQNIVDPIESQEARSAATTSLRRMEVDLITMIVIMFTAVSPFFALNQPTSIKTSACLSSPAINSENKQDAVFGELILDNQVVRVPPWFYLVMSVTGGVVNEIVDKLPCKINIRQMNVQASSILIDNALLRRDVNRFAAECYSPARADYFNRNNGKVNTSEQLAWLGSDYFVNGRYRSIYAANPVEGFAYNPSRESDASHAKTPNGRPSCADWWSAEQHGLRSQLLADYPPDWLVNLKSLYNTKNAEDAAIRKILQNERQGFSELDLTGRPDYGGGESFISLHPMDLPGDLVSSTVQWAGGAAASLVMSFITNMVVKALPYVQSFALFAVYFLLPIALIAGHYSIEVIKTATLYIVAVKFWTVIWAVVAILDNRLTKALTIRDGVHPIDYISSKIGYEAILSNLLILALYVSLPLFLMSMLSWAGERGMSAGSNMTKTGTSEAKASGQKGVSVAKTAATKGK